MDTVTVDIAIVGAGGGGLRAAIAAAEADPTLSIALISKVYPMRSHTVAAEGAAAAVTQPHDSLEAHFHDTVAGGMLSALLGTMLVFITGIAVPLGWTLPPHLMSYPRMLACAERWWGKVLIFVIIALFAWHAVHRIFHSLHDLGVRNGTLAKAVCYGGALAITLVTAAALISLGF